MSCRTRAVRVALILSLLIAAAAPGRAQTDRAYADAFQIHGLGAPGDAPEPVA